MGIATKKSPPYPFHESVKFLRTNLMVQLLSLLKLYIIYKFNKQVGLRQNITTRVTNLNQLLNNEFNPEILQPDERVPCYTCDHTGSQRPPCTKLVSMHTFPKYWIITLKMFDNQRNKLQTTVRTPFSFMRNNRIYILLSAIIHEGDKSHEGHYIQIGRTDKDCNEAWKRKNRSIPLWFQYGQWFQSNDSRQIPMKLERIKTLLNNNKKRRSWRCFRSPYILIYKRFMNDKISTIPIPTDMPNIVSHPIEENNTNNNNNHIDRNTTFYNNDNDVQLVDLETHNNNTNNNNTRCNDDNKDDDINVHNNGDCNDDNKENNTTCNNDNVELSSTEIWNCPRCNKLVVFVDHCMVCGLLERDAKSLSETINASLEKPNCPDINMENQTHEFNNNDNDKEDMNIDNDNTTMQQSSGLTQDFQDTVNVDQPSLRMHWS